MSKRNPLGIGPDWENLSPEELKSRKRRGLLLSLLGLSMLVQFLPTIQLLGKIAAAFTAGIGVNLFRTAHKFLNNQ